MTTDYKVTELFCIIDEFCKYFEAENAGNLLEDSSDIKRRRRSVSLSDSEIMTILLYFIQKIEDKKNLKHSLSQIKYRTFATERVLWVVMQITARCYILFISNS